MITLDYKQAEACENEAARKGIQSLRDFFRSIKEFIGSDLAIRTVSFDLDRETSRIASDALDWESHGR